MYKTVLFDLDGTLTDPGEGITNSVAFALQKWGITVNDKTELYPFIGPPLSESFQKYYGFSEEDSIKAVYCYREYFSVKGLYENKVYDGVTEMLAALKELGIRIVLATSKPEPYAIEILKHFDLHRYFDCIAGATMDESRNKKDEVITYALDTFGITDKESTVMVGDRHHDILGAKKNGIDSIGVLYGYGDFEELTSAGACALVETVEALCKKILNKD